MAFLSGGLNLSPVPIGQCLWKKQRLEPVTVWKVYLCMMKGLAGNVVWRNCHKSHCTFCRLSRTTSGLNCTVPTSCWCQHDTQIIFRDKSLIFGTSSAVFLIVRNLTLYQMSESQSRENCFFSFHFSTILLPVIFVFFLSMNDLLQDQEHNPHHPNHFKLQRQ